MIIIRLRETIKIECGNSGAKKETDDCDMERLEIKRLVLFL